MDYPLTDSFTHPPKFLAISSINYGPVPTIQDSNNVLFATARYHPPSDFRVDSTVRLHLSPGVGINTNPNPGLNSVFVVIDIVGMHIVLKPLSNSWRPDLGKPGQVWGYDMNKTNVRPPNNYWQYGFGTPITFLEYYPREF